MSYEGNIATLILGKGGLYTDDPHTIIPPGKLFRAENITINNNVIEKDFGSRRWNSVQMSSAIKALFSWKPEDVYTRIITVNADGSVYRHKQRNFFSQILPDEDVDPINASGIVNMIQGGAEQTNKPRKAFIFAENNVVQVLVGDSEVHRDIENPAADWKDNSQPFKAIVHRRRMVAFGNRNAPHNIYFSSSLDHEDFAGGVTFEIFPGTSDRVIDAFTYKGRLFVLKDPLGLYFVDDSDINVANWSVVEINTDFGSSSTNSTVTVKDDVLIANNFGTVTSLTATQKLGDLKSGDIYNILKIETGITEQMNVQPSNSRQIIYYQQRKIVYITYHASGGGPINRLVQMDVSKGSPEVTIITKDQPNVISMIRDHMNILRPYYGANDGYIYEMDMVDRNVGGNAYKAEFSTPALDFVHGDLLKAEFEKQYDFVEFVFIPTGNITMDFEVTIDGRPIKTGSFDVIGRSHLDQIKTDTGRTDSLAPLTKRVPVSGKGRRIAIKVSNGNINENFKLSKINIYYKPTGNNQTIGV